MENSKGLQEQKQPMFAELLSSLRNQANQLEKNVSEIYSHVNTLKSVPTIPANDEKIKEPEGIIEQLFYEERRIADLNSKLMDINAHLHNLIGT